MTKILPCKCQHAYQDKKYGRGMRVHNLAKSKNLTKLAWTCTICGIKKDTD